MSCLYCDKHFQCSMSYRRLRKTSRSLRLSNEDTNTYKLTLSHFPSHLYLWHMLMWESVCLCLVSVSVNLPAHCANVVIISHLYHNNIALLWWECGNGQEQNITVGHNICLSTQG